MSFQTARASAGSGEVPGRVLSLAAARLEWRAWLFSGMRPGRVPWRGVAQEGSAQLEV